MKRLFGPRANCCEHRPFRRLTIQSLHRREVFNAQMDFVVPADVTGAQISTIDPSNPVVAASRISDSSDATSVFFEPVDLMQFEQAMLEEINRIRQDPQGWADATGIDLNRGLAPGTISGHALPPLAPSQILVDVAQRHTLDMLDGNYFSHTNRQGDSPSDRAFDAGYAVGVGENIGYISNPYIGLEERSNENEWKKANVGGWLLQCLMESDPHRSNLLGSYSEIGIGIDVGAYSVGSETWPVLMATQVFGNSLSQASLTGVVYEDSFGVADGRFTASEGTSGVLMTATDADGNSYQTRTGISGGYTLPLPPGVYDVTASIDTRLPLSVGTVQVGKENVKFDLEMGRSSNPVPRERNRMDVDGDGQVSARDALQVINAIGAGREYQSHGDINGDGLISPLDALNILNHLARVQAEPESQSLTQSAETIEIQADHDEKGASAVDRVISQLW
ncbi:dockerin type I domain-containing protein [Roseiconus lacunae]|uniref:dockerin type I domain-containing protein n=1 Tax=Roseiconus lacunae TaxID=2605694 RepID=UPI00308735F1|nr:dockerin type I domain-containing protein [Stieleria sp. HD01]